MVVTPPAMMVMARTEMVVMSPTMMMVTRAEVMVVAAVVMMVLNQIDRSGGGRPDRHRRRDGKTCGADHGREG